MHGNEMKITSKFLLKIIEKQLFLPILAINKSLSLSPKI
jgi:hypothetical protein